MASESTQSQYLPNYASPPGDTLAEALADRSMSQAELAQRTGRSKKLINEIVRGKAPITHPVAEELERVLGIPARFWNNRESQYREALERIRQRDRLKEYLPWLRTMPYRQMIRQGWLNEGDDDVDQLQKLLSFFGVATPAQWREIWNRSKATFRTSAAYQADPRAVAAWMRKGELEAQRVECEPFDREIFVEALQDIRHFTCEMPEDFLPKLRSVCASSGVALVFVPQLPKTRSYGATWWLTPHRALIQLTLRGKANDRLWFTFFHEAGHILLHGKRDVFIEDSEQTTRDEKEEEADRFAGDSLIPPDAYGAFVADKVFTRLSVQRLARDVGIGAGIVVGRLQHDGHISWRTRLNRLKIRLKWTAKDG